MVMTQEFHALCREPVDVRRLIVFAAEARNIRVTKVVSHDEDDVRLRRWCIGGVQCSLWSQHQGGQDQKDAFHYLPSFLALGTRIGAPFEQVTRPFDPDTLPLTMAART